MWDEYHKHCDRVEHTLGQRINIAQHDVVYVTSMFGKSKRSFVGKILSSSTETDIGKKCIYHEQFVKTDNSAVDTIRYALEPYQRQHNTIYENARASIPPPHERMMCIQVGMFLRVYGTRRVDPRAKESANKRMRTSFGNWKPNDTPDRIVEYSAIWVRPLHIRALSIDAYLDSDEYDECVKALLKDLPSVQQKLTDKLSYSRKKSIYHRLMYKTGGDEADKKHPDELKRSPWICSDLFPTIMRGLTPKYQVLTELCDLHNLERLFAVVREHPCNLDDTKQVFKECEHEDVRAFFDSRQKSFVDGCLYVQLVDQLSTPFNPRRKTSFLYDMPPLPIGDIARIARHCAVRTSAGARRVDVFHQTLMAYDFLVRAFDGIDAQGDTLCYMRDLSGRFMSSLSKLLFPIGYNCPEGNKLDQQESALNHLARHRLESYTEAAPLNRTKLYPSENLAEVMRRKTMVLEKKFGVFMCSLWNKRKGHDGQPVVMSYNLHHKETKVVQKLNEIIDCRDRKLDGVKIETLVDQLNRRAVPYDSPVMQAGIYPNVREFQEIWDTLDRQQKKAVCNVILSPLSFITGPPGTGKTQVSQATAALFNKKQLSSAPYGIIACMLDKRTGTGYTCHRLGSISAFCRSLDNNPEAKYICEDSRVLVFDEIEQGTIEHLFRSLCSSDKFSKDRILFLGDIEQSGAIGGGSIVDSFWRRYSDNRRVFTRLRVPYRFLTKEERKRVDLESLVAEKPENSHSMRCIPWNTHQLAYSEHAQDHVPKLVYSTDINDKQARVLFAPLGTNAQQQMAQLRDILGDDYLGIIMSERCQILTHTNAMKNEMLRTIVSCARYPTKNGVIPPTNHFITRSFHTGDKITFLRNLYLSKKQKKKSAKGDEGDEDPTRDDYDDFEILRMMSRRGRSHKGRDTNKTGAGGVDDAQPQEYFAMREKKRQMIRKRNKTWRGTQSDDVYNGQVKILDYVARVNNSGRVLSTFEQTDQLQDDPRPKDCKKTMLVFRDNTQVAVEDIEWKDVVHGCVFTYAKYHGEQCPIIILMVENVRHLSARHFRTCITRAKQRFIFMTGKDETQCATNVREIISHKDGERFETFAESLHAF